jgi:ribosomal-protein-alanine N-acetyltransferase
MTLRIESERLCLRRFNLADVTDLMAFVAHPSVANEVQEMGTTESEIRDYIELQNSFEPFELQKVFDLGIERKVDNKLIGIVTTIVKQHRKAEIGYGLGIGHRGLGYATEATRTLINYGFNYLDLHRVQAIVSSGNPPSIQVVERLGLKLEGRLREANFRDRQWCDLLYYGILRDEWNIED